MFCVNTIHVYTQNLKIYNIQLKSLGKILLKTVYCKKKIVNAKYLKKCKIKILLFYTKY